MIKRTENEFFTIKICLKTSVIVNVRIILRNKSDA